MILACQWPTVSGMRIRMKRTRSGDVTAENLVRHGTPPGVTLVDVHIVYPTPNATPSGEAEESVILDVDEGSHAGQLILRQLGFFR